MMTHHVQRVRATSRLGMSEAAEERSLGAASPASLRVDRASLGHHFSGAPAPRRAPTSGAASSGGHAIQRILKFEGAKQNLSEEDLYGFPKIVSDPALHAKAIGAIRHTSKTFEAPTSKSIEGPSSQRLLIQQLETLEGTPGPTPSEHDPLLHAYRRSRVFFVGRNSDTSSIKLGLRGYSTQVSPHPSLFFSKTKASALTYARSQKLPSGKENLPVSEAIFARGFLSPEQVERQHHDRDTKDYWSTDGPTTGAFVQAKSGRERDRVAVPRDLTYVDRGLRNELAPQTGTLHHATEDDLEYERDRLRRGRAIAHNVLGVVPAESRPSLEQARSMFRSRPEAFDDPNLQAWAGLTSEEHARLDHQVLTEDEGRERDKLERIQDAERSKLRADAEKARKALAPKKKEEDLPQWVF